MMRAALLLLAALLDLLPAGSTARPAPADAGGLGDRLIADRLLRLAIERRTFGKPPPEVLDRNGGGRALAAALLYEWSVDHPGGSATVCARARRLARDPDPDVAGPALLALARCSGTPETPIPSIGDRPEDVTQLAPGVLGGEISHYREICLRIRSPGVRAGELLLRMRGLIRIASRPPSFGQAPPPGRWRTLPIGGGADLELCALPLDLRLDLRVVWRPRLATRTRSHPQPGRPPPGLSVTATQAVLLRALAMDDRDMAAAALARRSSGGVVASTLRALVGARWPELTGGEIPSQPVTGSGAGAGLSATHRWLALKRAFDLGRPEHVLRGGRSGREGKPAATLALRARSLDALGWTAEAREEVLAAVAADPASCRLRSLAMELGATAIGAPRACELAQREPAKGVPESEADPVAALVGPERWPRTRAWLHEPPPENTPADGRVQNARVLLRSYLVRLHADGGADVFRRSVTEITSARGADAFQHWSADGGWSLLLLERLRHGVPPRPGHILEDDPGMLLEDIRPGDRVHVVENLRVVADPYRGLAGLDLRLPCADPDLPVLRCDVRVESPAGHRPRVEAHGLRCSGQGRCRGGPWPAPHAEPDPADPWVLVPHVRVRSSLPPEARLARARLLLRAALMTARPPKLSETNGRRAPGMEEIHRRVHEAPRREALGPAVALGVDPRDLDLVAALRGLGLPATLVRIAEPGRAADPFGAGRLRVFIDRGPAPPSVWWTSLLPLPFAAEIPGLDRGRSAVSLGPEGIADLRVPVGPLTGGQLRAEGRLERNTRTGAIRGEVLLTWRGGEALSLLLADSSALEPARAWTAAIFPGLTPDGPITVSTPRGSVEVRARVPARLAEGLGAEDLAIQLFRADSLARLLADEHRKSDVVLPGGLDLVYRLRLEQPPEGAAAPRSDLRVQGRHADLHCVRRLITGRGLDLRCRVILPAEVVPAGSWEAFRDDLARLGQHQRVPLIP